MRRNCCWNKSSIAELKIMCYKTLNSSFGRGMAAQNIRIPSHSPNNQTFCHLQGALFTLFRILARQLSQSPAQPIVFSRNKTEHDALLWGFRQSTACCLPVLHQHVPTYSCFSLPHCLIDVPVQGCFSEFLLRTFGIALLYGNLYVYAQTEVSRWGTNCLTS